jgi:glycerol-3-phosphate dehydrogenase
VRRDLARLCRGTFDVLVVGGGIHGAAAVREAAARGLSAALIEQGDFGHATSANSLKIIHGGLRYLQHGDLAKIRDSVRARRAVLRRFPHLVAPLPCVLPTRGFGMRSRPALAVARARNDLLGADRNLGVVPGCRIPRGRTISRGEFERLAPGFADRKASGGAVWYDAIADDTERLVLELVLDADASGAAVANRLRAEEFLRRGGRIEGVRARDEIGGGALEIRARVTVLAAGPWLGELERAAGGGEKAPAPPALAKALNIVVGRRIFGDVAVGVEGGGGEKRLFFFVPWRGGTMIGTRYVPHDGPAASCAVNAEDLERMVADINRMHPAAGLSPEEVRFAHVGLLPLDPGANPQAAVEARLLKRPRVIDAARDFDLEGMVAILGVKYTTGMTVGVRAIDLACRKLGLAATRAASPFRREPSPVALPPGIDAAMAERLLRTYGDAGGRMLRGVADDPALARRVDPAQPTTAAEVLHAVREEMAATLADIVLRRTPLGTFGNPGRAVLEACAAIAAAELGWDESRREREVSQVEAEYRRLLGGRVA